jgi:hypothetical protein
LVIAAKVQKKWRAMGLASVVFAVFFDATIGPPAHQQKLKFRLWLLCTIKYGGSYGS